VVVEEVASKVVVELPTPWPHPAAHTRVTINTNVKMYLLLR